MDRGRWNQALGVASLIPAVIGYLLGGPIGAVFGLSLFLGPVLCWTIGPTIILNEFGWRPPKRRDTDIIPPDERPPSSNTP